MIFYQSSIKVLSKFYLTIITNIICLECPSEVCESWIQCNCTSMMPLYTCSNTDDGHSRSCSIIPIFTELELVGFILYLAVQRLKDNGHLHHVLTGSPFDVEAAVLKNCAPVDTEKTHKDKWNKWEKRKWDQLRYRDQIDLKTMFMLVNQICTHGGMNW